MGLDVHLHKCSHWYKAIEVREKYNEESDKIWDDQILTGDQKIEKCKELDKTFDCDEYGSPNSIEDIEQPSPGHPDHMFQIGYFRSSYNNAGLNIFFQDIGLPDLYDIFAVDDKNESYYVAVNWKDSLTRCDKTIDAYKKHLASPIGNHNVVFIGQLIFCESKDTVKTPKEALGFFAKELDIRNKKENDMKWYMTGGIGANFMFPGIEVNAVIPGNGPLNEPGVYVIYKSKNVDDNGNNWYLDALEIVKETIGYVLSQDDPDQFRLGWSA